MITSAVFPPCEGVGFYVWNLSRFLSEAGHKVHIITRGSSARLQRAVHRGITVWRPRFLPLYPLHVHLHAAYVQQLLRHLSPDLDLLHLHSPLVRRPNSLHPKLVTVHTPMKSDVASLPADTLTGLLARLQRPVSTRLEQELFRDAGRVAAVAHSVARELQCYGLDPSLIAVIGNGVDVETFRPCGTPPVPRYVLSAGRLAQRKGLEDLLQCASQVVREEDDVQFLIAGHGPLAPKLQRMIERLDLKDHVRLLGHISDRNRLAALYSGAAAFVHPAHYEGLPTVLLEAMACAAPVVATAVSGALDVIRHGRNGLLVPARSPDQMAAAVLRLLHTPALGRQLGASARETICEQYTWSHLRRRYEHCYHDLLNGAAG